MIKEVARNTKDVSLVYIQLNGVLQLILFSSFVSRFFLHNEFSLIINETL